MKLIKKYLLVVVLSISFIGLNSCKKDYLEPQPYGRYTPQQLESKKALESLLVAAYGFIDGSGTPGSSGWMVGATNWVYGDVASDDAYTGTDANDQPQMRQIELWNTQADNTYFYYKWLSLYEGVYRANDIIKFAAKIPALLTDAEKQDYIAQARFLRGHFHFEAKRMWNKVPYITEATTTYDNNADIWPMIETDIKKSYDNIPEKQPLVGKVNKWAAGAYLAKVLMYEKKFAEAKALYDVIIAKGTNSNGVKYNLQSEYWKNFDIAFENSSEAVFSQQCEAGGTVNASAETSYELAYPYGSKSVWGCCGFYQPSQNLVNAFKVDANGLPLLDDSYNNTKLKNDEGIVSKDPFINDNTIPLDPRLDWAVGRRGIPYYDHGAHPGYDWIRDQGYSGPYSPKKHVTKKSDFFIFTNISNIRQTAKNYNIIRFADVLLMAAEAEIESGSLAKAQDYINRVRGRAADPVSWVTNAPFTGGLATPANYAAKLYTTPFADQAYARKAVRFERRLELAMEGHRFFDLVRWGIADQVLNAYLAVEKVRRTYKTSSGGFTKKNEYYPIPAREIDVATLAGNTLVQNPGY